MSQTAPHYNYTKAQIYVLEYVVYLSAPLSILGSGLVIYVIFYERHSLANSVYHRLMLGMSILDFLCSTSLIVFGPWAIPEDIDYVYNGRGNFTTCSISGFFLNLIFGTMFYSATLAVYFLLVIRYRIREKWIARYIEPVGHCLAIGQPLLTGIFGLVYEMINPMAVLPGWCWFNDYPSECLEDDDVECLRGKTVPPVAFLAAGPLMFVLIFAVIAVSMILIVLKVRETERRIQRYAGQSDQNYERTKEVGRQAILYIASFLLTYFPIGGSQVTHNSSISVKFLFAFLVKTLSSMQGLFNAIVFLRNQYRALTAQGQSLYFLRNLIVHDKHSAAAKPQGAPELPHRNDSDVNGSTDQTATPSLTTASSGQKAIVLEERPSDTLEVGSCRSPHTLSDQELRSSQTSCSSSEIPFWRHLRVEAG